MGLTFLSRELSRVSSRAECDWNLKKAAVAELVDAADLKSADPRSCGFDPRRWYFFNQTLEKIVKKLSPFLKAGVFRSCLDFF